MKLGEEIGNVIIDYKPYTIDIVFGVDPKKGSHLSFTSREEPSFIPNFYRLFTRELLEQELIGYHLDSNKLTVNIKPFKFGTTISPL